MFVRKPEFFQILLIAGSALALAFPFAGVSAQGRTPADFYNSRGESPTTLRGGVQQNVQASGPIHCIDDAWRAVQRAVQAYQLALNGALNQSFACHGQASSAELEACWALLNQAKAKIEQAGPVYERARNAGPLGTILTAQANRLNGQARTSLEQARQCYQPIFDRSSQDAYIVNRPGRNSTLPPNAQLPPAAPPPRGNLPGPIGYEATNVTQNYGTRPCMSDGAVGLVQGTLMVESTKDPYSDPKLSAPQTMVLLLNQNNKPGRMGQTWQFQITSATKVNWPHPGPPSQMANVHFPCQSRDLIDIFFLPATRMVPALEVRRANQTPTSGGPDVGQCLNAVANVFCQSVDAKELDGKVQENRINTGSGREAYYPPPQMVSEPNSKLKGRTQGNQPAGKSSITATTILCGNDVVYWFNASGQEFKGTVTITWRSPLTQENVQGQWVTLPTAGQIDPGTGQAFLIQEFHGNFVLGSNGLPSTFSVDRFKDVKGMEHVAYGKLRSGSYARGVTISLTSCR